MVFGGKEKERKSDPKGKEGKRSDGFGEEGGESWGLVMSLCGEVKGD